jgi:hypothetical protein
MIGDIHEQPPGLEVALGILRELEKRQSLGKKRAEISWDWYKHRSNSTARGGANGRLKNAALALLARINGAEFRLHPNAWSAVAISNSSRSDTPH